MGQITNLQHLFINRLILLHKAETRVEELLINIQTRISSLHLKRLVDDHAERNILHLESIRIILEEMGEEILTDENDSVATLIKELESVMDECKETEVIDAAVIGSLQNIIHYLISGYGTCKAYANSLSMPEIEKLLNNIVKDQKLQDDRLSRLAKENINEKAKSPMMF